MLRCYTISSCGRWAVLLLVVVMWLSACSPQRPRPVRMAFTIDTMLRTTPVADQGRSQLCWVYAMLGTIETDRLMQGDSVSLSVAYPVRRYMEELATESLLRSPAYQPTMRGMASLALSLTDTYGALPADAYPMPADASADALLRGIVQMARFAPSVSVLQGRVADMLDARMGTLPHAAYMLGARYTFAEFAHSVYAQRYVAITSFTHHPFGRPFVLEVPDNVRRHSFDNIPLDTLMARIDRALTHGYAVCWEGDVSEPGFSFARGVATLPPGTVADQEHRQRQFERRLTTDDHCMVLIGIAHDRRGHRYYVAKNSWGTHNPYGGMMYLSEEYVRMKTIAIYINNETCHL